jgi:hypothetical protein
MRCTVPGSTLNLAAIFAHTFGAAWCLERGKDSRFDNGCHAWAPKPLYPHSWLSETRRGHVPERWYAQILRTRLTSET